MLQPFSIGYILWAPNRTGILYRTANVCVVYNFDTVQVINRFADNNNNNKTAGHACGERSVSGDTAEPHYFLGSTETPDPRLALAGWPRVEAQERNLCSKSGSVKGIKPGVALSETAAHLSTPFSRPHQRCPLRCLHWRHI